MHTKVLILLFFVGLMTSSQSSSFLDEQKKFPRVRTALEQKGETVSDMLSKNGLAVADLNVLFVAYKDEGLLELYGKRKSDTQYKLIASYAVCAKSGVLGPKRRQGDMQVPEGFYHIDRFNPNSNFYLSLGISYPNESDKKLSEHANLGGDIFIHGSCVTIGCLPMTDDKIKEIYLFAVYARSCGQQKIPVYIFPFQMSSSKYAMFKETYANNPSLLSFWDNLLEGYNLFLNQKEELVVLVTASGSYSFSK